VRKYIKYLTEIERSQAFAAMLSSWLPLYFSTSEIFSKVQSPSLRVGKASKSENRQRSQTPSSRGDLPIRYSWIPARTKEKGGRH
jgi:hypothetical protein